MCCHTRHRSTTHTCVRHTQQTTTNNRWALCHSTGDTQYRSAPLGVARQPPIEGFTGDTQYRSAPLGVARQPPIEGFTGDTQYRSAPLGVARQPPIEGFTGGNIPTYQIPH
ncbi:uncharacterized protein LOC142987091 [Anticarsia gemmatalis]|uniref:uncharacterized protein LOC142987091 n=1 Tax=Anticarsia gemmatalis TaxID=129554 RepID=UPI003F76C691